MATSEFPGNKLETVSQVDMERLRRELHAAVDGIVDRLSEPRPDQEKGPPGGDEPEIAAGDEFGLWTYRWPDKQEEEFASGRWYALRGTEETINLRLAWTTRKAWGRDRGRAIIFQQVGGDGSQTYYPLAEFVETDDPGLFASPIPDPDRPRALLAEGSALPPRFHYATVERADRVFRSIENGPSLRLIVEQENEVEMIRHGYWVGRVRGRI